MNFVKTIFDYKQPENEDKIDDKQPYTSQKNETTVMNENTVIPPKLTVEDVSLLVNKYFFRLNKEKLEKYIEKFKEQEIDGYALVEACNKEHYREKLKKGLGILLAHEIYFDEMIDMIRHRQNVLNGKNHDEEEDYQSSDETDQGSSKARVNTRTKDALGTKLKVDKTSKTKINHINVKRSGENFDGNAIGADVHSTDNSELTIDTIDVTVQNDNSDVKRKRRKI